MKAYGGPEVSLHTFLMPAPGVSTTLPPATISRHSLALRSCLQSGESYNFFCLPDIERALCRAGSSRAAIPTDYPSLTEGRKEI